MGDGEARYFDLNVETVLEHWSVAQAVRELLANALDEHLLGCGAEPEIVRLDDGTWRIRDFGRGLRHEHLTQNENPEKLASPNVIGRFGVGLKDALAVLDRHGSSVELRSRWNTITTAMHPKAGFPDTHTLHAVVGPAPDDEMVGTTVDLASITDAQMDDAKAFFLRWNGEQVLETTDYGSVLAHGDGQPGRVYVRGLRVAQEDELLFSYDITKLNAKLTRALNRERANVGRSAYSDRLKDILLATSSAAVAGPLAEDLAAFESGEQRAESGWVDVALHAAKVLNAAEPVVFVTTTELSEQTAMVEYAREDGLRVIVVPKNVAKKLVGATDVDGEPVRTLKVFARQRMESFVFTFVDRAALTDAEAALLDLADDAFALADRTPVPVLISETMRPAAVAADDLGLWDPAARHIVIRRDQLRTPRAFFATLLHEIAHSLHNEDDATLAFENTLSELLGRFADAAIDQ